MRTGRLEFEEFPDEHVIVRLSGIPLAEFFEVRDKADVLTWDQASFEALRAAFQPYLIEWSFEEPIEDGVFAHHVGLGMAIVREWLRAVRDVPGPLLPRSSDGAASEDQSSSNPTS